MDNTTQPTGWELGLMFTVGILTTAVYFYSVYPFPDTMATAHGIIGGTILSCGVGATGWILTEISRRR